jgi:hypothetical protein
VNLKQKFWKGGAIAALAVILSGVFAPLAFAADANNPEGAFNIVISPPATALTVKPGGSVATDIKVQNRGLSTEHVKVSLMKFGAYGQEGKPDLKELTPADEFGKWASFSPAKFEAEPNIWKTVRVTINPPKNAAFGYYYAIIFSRDGAQSQAQKKQANLLGSVASLILLDVQAPGAVRKTAIAEFSTAHKVQEFLPQTFAVRMHNTGNVHVVTRGNIIISKGGKNIALLEVNLAKGYILPGSYRKFDAEWKDGTPRYVTKTADGKVVQDKNGQPITNLSWDNFSMSKLRFGKYEAKLIMVYNDGRSDVSNEAKLSFWIMPWRIIAVIAVIALLVLAGIWAILRPLRQRLKRRHTNYVPPRNT